MSHLLTAVWQLKINIRYKVRVISHFFFQSLQIGEICGFPRPETLLILHSVY